MKKIKAINLRPMSLSELTGFGREVLNLAETSLPVDEQTLLGVACRHVKRIAHIILVTTLLLSLTSCKNAHQAQDTPVYIDIQTVAQQDTQAAQDTQTVAQQDIPGVLPQTDEGKHNDNDLIDIEPENDVNDAPQKEHLIGDPTCEELFEEDGIEAILEAKYDPNCKLDKYTPADRISGTERYARYKTMPQNLQKDRDALVTPIFYASDLEEVEALIKAGADVNAVDTNGQTFLFYYVLEDDFFEECTELYKYLKKNKYNFNAKDNSGRTVLHMAIVEMLKNTYGMIEDGVLSGEDLNDDEGSGYSKSFEYQSACIKEMLKAGADVKGGKATRDALIKASPEKFVKEIIKAGLDINGADFEGLTPLQRLVNYKVRDMPFGPPGLAEIYRKNGQTLRTINTELYDSIKVLIDAGADVNVKDSEGRTPLHLSENPHVAYALIAAGADINAKDNAGRTPLHAAVLYSPLIIDVIFDACPDTTIQDNDGKTASDLAQSENIKNRFNTYDPSKCHDTGSDNSPKPVSKPVAPKKGKPIAPFR